ncbi:hypothetical protein D3C80_2003150 [compost metagenome]
MQGQLEVIALPLDIGLRQLRVAEPDRRHLRPQPFAAQAPLRAPGIGQVTATLKLLDAQRVPGRTGNAGEQAQQQRGTALHAVTPGGV